MISDLDWLKIGRATRDTPPRSRTRRGRMFAVALFGGMTLLVSGCQSGPLSNCRMFSPCGFFARATNRVFHRDRGCCGSTAVSDGVVEYGAPAGVVVPGPGAIPSYSPGGVIGTSPSNVPPSASDSPSYLEEAPPKAKAGPTGGSSSTGSGARSTSYYARRPSTPTAMRSRRSPMSSPASTPEPTSQSAQASSNRSGNEPANGNDDNVLDHLPPLDLPGEVTKTASPPTPPAAGAEAKASQAAPGDRTTQRDTAPVEADLPLAVATDPVPETASAAGIGITRFASVNLKLAGGSLPSATGLTWLADKGYRTLVDLRDSSEVSPTFIASVTNRGLRYVALPVSLKTIGAEHVARFHFEIGSADARPLFFFDSDGSRPGALWYIRRLTIDKVDPQIARREAEELGLVDKTAWLATTGYLEKREAERANPASARSSPVIPPASTATQAPSNNHASVAEPKCADVASSITEPNAANERAPVASVPIGNPGKPTDADSQPIRDTLAWRPLAAVLLTGLSVPLVYWTRTAVPAMFSKARASLPAPGPQPQSLP